MSARRQLELALCLIITIQKQANDLFFVTIFIIEIAMFMKILSSAVSAVTKI